MKAVLNRLRPGVVAALLAALPVAAALGGAAPSLAAAQSQAGLAGPEHATGLAGRGHDLVAICGCLRACHRHPMPNRDAQDI